MTLNKALERKYSLYRQNMTWLTSTVAHFLTDISKGISLIFQKAGALEFKKKKKKNGEMEFCFSQNTFFLILTKE